MICLAPQTILPQAQVLSAYSAACNPNKQEGSASHLHTVQCLVHPNMHAPPVIELIMLQSMHLTMS